MSRDFITPAYTFTPGASGVGTVNLSGISSFNVRRLAAIINQTRGVTIFATGADSLGYTQVSGTTLTLFANTSSHSASDALVIVYDSAEGSPISDTASQALAATPVRQVGQKIDVAGFNASGNNVLDSFFGQSPVVGTGVSFTQTSGSLVITSGTTISAEFLARSVKSYRGSMRMRFSIITSARNANTNFAVMLADLIGENLAYTINSTTSVTVTVNHSLTAADAGQFVQIGGITGGAIPGRYAIASGGVAVGSLTFTVSGFPGSGSGTCTLFGRNYIKNLVTATTATQLFVDAQRNGWATGDTTATFNTTVSPGTMVQVEQTGREVFWFDSLRASTATPTTTVRASRFENIPDATTDLFVFLWSFNGTTSPASTIYTLGHLSVESFPNNSVYLQGIRSIGASNPLAASVTGSLTTVSSITSANLAIPGTVADVASAAITSNSTTAAITPTAGCSYIVSIPVTAVTGTTPTLDINIDESDDTGTNWETVYSFPRITATGSYRSPKLSFTGNRVRYSQTVTGTSPSFTRAINRLQCSDTVSYVRQLIDRTINLTTTTLPAAATPRLVIQNCSRVQLVVLITAATTAPTLQLQGSDDNAATWYPIGAALPAVASTTSPQTITVANVNAQMLRAIVTVAGTGVTMGYVLIKAF